MVVALDPQMKAMLDFANASGPMFLRAETPEQAREKLQALLEAQATEPPAVYRVEDRHIPGPHAPVPVRIYTAEGRVPKGVLVYFHGGGWVLGSITTHDVLCRSLANGAKCIVVAVDYRLAPEHKFPAAPEDCYAAAKWVVLNAAAFGGDPARIAIGGDSAGGNLTAAVGLMAAERGTPTFRFQLLIYPVTSYAFDTASYR